MDAPEPRHRQYRNRRKSKRAHASHNLVEKRYRANLNQKIVDLQAVVPSLYSSGSSSGEKPRKSEGTQDPQKIPKATVLNRAIEYIHELETRNRLLEKNMLVMEHHIESTKIDKQVHLDQGAVGGQVNDVGKEQALNVRTTHQVEGMIQVPLEIQKLHSQHPGSLYIKSVLCDYDLVRGQYHEQDESSLRSLHLGSLAL